jgi:hypothetical protein
MHATYLDELVRGLLVCALICALIAGAVLPGILMRMRSGD